jgi:hypothetical protein
VVWTAFWTLFRHRTGNKVPDCRSARWPDEYSHLFTFVPNFGSSLLGPTCAAAVPAYARLITAQLDVEPMTVLDDEPSSRSDVRSFFGFAVIVLAMASVLIGSAVLRPGVIGQAVVDPRLLPPGPGTCLLLERLTPTVVDCALPHHAEITASWWAGDPGAPVTDPTRRAALINGSDCYHEAAIALGLDSTNRAWLPIEPVVTARAVQSAPGVQSAVSGTEHGWTACVVAPPDGRLFTGSTQAPTVSSWPDPFARCVTTGTEVAVVDCAQPHGVEVFGRFNATSRYGSPLPRPDPRVLLDECTELIRHRVGTTDPTFGGLVAIRAQPLLPGWRYDALESDAVGHRTVASYPTPFCFIETLSGELMATLIARGNRPVPLR